MSGPNDFTVALADVIDSLQDRVRDGVEQPASFAVIYKSSVSSYELPRSAIGVSRVTGLRAKAFSVFLDGADYRFSGARLNWTDGGARPDEGARVEIEYTFREPPSGLTDFNPGSVVGTLLRAVAREMTLLYAQMDQAYRRAFIDDADGVALDNVVALLGVKRIPALKSKGAVTFLRKRAATRTVVIPNGTRIADQSGRVFITVAEGRIDVETDEVLSPQGAVVRTSKRIAALTGVFRKADDPASATPLSTNPGFGADERTITLAAIPSDDLRVRYRPKSVTVPIEAVESGPGGDVSANAIVLMPTPPQDVDAVVNEDPTSGGQDAEPDERLRERAKHALERAGNATLNAIRFAVLEVEGVQGVEVLDHLRDDAIPLGEVRVRYSGGDLNAVRAAVERTRAAGVLAKVEEIVTVWVEGTFYLIPADTGVLAAPAPFAESVGAAIASLHIGDPLQIKRLNALAFGVAGLADVAEAQLLSHKPLPSSPGNAVQSDPLLVSGSELIRPAPGGIRGVMLAKLVVTGHARLSAGIYTISVQVQDAQGNAPVFRSFSIDLNLTGRATLADTPTQPAQRVGSVIKTAVFTSATATLRVEIAKDLPDFHANQHTHVVEFVLNAAAPTLAWDRSVTRSTSPSRSADMSYKTDRLVDLFPDAYAASERDSLLHKILDAVGAEFMAADENVKRLLKSHWVQYAEADALDKLGAMFGVERRRLRSGGIEPDVAFRRRLMATVPLFTGGGTTEAVKGAVRSALGLPFNLDQLNLPPAYQALREDIEALVTLHEFSPKGDRVLENSVTAVPLDARSLTAELTLSTVAGSVAASLPRIEWTFDVGIGRRLFVQRLDSGQGFRSVDGFVAPTGQTIVFSAGADNRLSAVLDGAERADQFVNFDGTSPALMPPVPVSASQWRFRAQAGVYDVGSFDDGASFDLPAFHVAVSRVVFEPLTFDVEVPYFIQNVVAELQRQHGYTGDIFAFEGIPLEHIQEVVEDTRAAGVRGSVQFYLRFFDDHAAGEQFSGDLTVGFADDAGAKESLLVANTNDQDESHDMGERLILAAVFDISKFEGPFGFL